ncbi:unnamed protein product [Mytilus edulis]|uniref:Protein kinase domain-containing protein n=1 Tax=Mytilus edulis TaxID=6550 RepID=A0A8S3SHK3_MYTED|nr:unnamed protein product [Mytilus edulis]
MDAGVGIRQLMEIDSKRRDKILEIYQDIEYVLQMDDDFRRVVKTDFDHITKDLDKLGSKLRSPECPILIAGETSAGKSTLINLLIGRSILPIKLLSCTSTICKIWNSEQRKIIFTNMQDEKEVHVFDMDDYEDKMKVLLSENVVKGSSDNEWKYVDIYFPVPLLENNITIVDSPGVQEDDNTTLMERLFDYLPNAIAFIYVIDSGRAGGVENDQWVKQSALCKVDEKCKAISKTIVNHLRASKDKMFNLSKSDLTADIEQITQIADNILENYVTEKHIFNRIKPFMDHMKDKITHVCEVDVPRKITADKIFLGNALKQRSSLKGHYQPISTSASKLNNRQQNIMKMYGISISKVCRTKIPSDIHGVLRKQLIQHCNEERKTTSLWKLRTSATVKESNSVRLADFGLSKNEENITGTVAGTPLYMAPEVMMGDLYGSEADIYSLGMVLYELWYYRPVFTRPLQSNPSKYEYTFHTRKDLEDNVLKDVDQIAKFPINHQSISKQ